MGAHKNRQAAVWHDIGYALTAQLSADAHSVDIVLRRPGGETALAGTIGTNGCGTLHTPSTPGLVLCGFAEIRSLQVALLRTWSVARDMLGHSIVGPKR